MREQAREFDRREVQILVVTTDARVEERGAHVILADRVETLSATYGVLLGGESRPATFVIDRSGAISFLYLGSNQMDRAPLDQVMDALRHAK